MTRRFPSAFRYAGGVAALAAVAALWLAFAPSRLGGSVDYAVIYGSSMEPSLRRGDLTVLHTRRSYAVGDAVGYHNRELGRVVLHRIVGRVGDRYVFKGDNNSFLDNYHPAGGELIGRMWVRVPGAGRALLWLRPPAHAGIAAALLVLVLLGGGGKEVRRRRDRRPGRPRVVLPGAEEPAPRGRGSAPAAATRSLLSLAAAGLLLFGLLAAIAYGSATTRRLDAPGAYTQQGAWTYSARGTAGAVYPGGRVETGQTVFARLVRSVRVGFSYRFATALPHDVAGTASLDARLTSTLGWSKPLPGAVTSAFRGDAVVLETTLDLGRLERALAAYYKATGVPSDNFNVVLTPRIETQGAVAGRKVQTSFAPTPLSFTLDAFALHLSMEAAGGSPGSAPVDPLHPSVPGSIERFTPRTIGLIGLGVATARRVADVGLLVSVALALIGLLLHRRKDGGDELSRMRRDHARLIVPVQSAPPAPEGGYVDVADLDSLAHLAASYERVILHRHEDGRDSFYVDDDGSVYRYRLGAAEAPPVPRTLASPVLR